MLIFLRKAITLLSLNYRKVLPPESADLSIRNKGRVLFATSITEHYSLKLFLNGKSIAYIPQQLMKCKKLFLVLISYFQFVGLLSSNTYKRIGVYFISYKNFMILRFHYFTEYIAMVLNNDHSIFPK